MIFQLASGEACLHSIRVEGIRQVLIDCEFPCLVIGRVKGWWGSGVFVERGIG